MPDPDKESTAISAERYKNIDSEDLIWDEWYRDHRNNDTVLVSTDDVHFRVSSYRLIASW